MNARGHRPISVVKIFFNKVAAPGYDELFIPEDVKGAFSKAFEGGNKSAVVAGLMRKAVEERERRRRSGDFVQRLRGIRARSRPVSDEEIRRIRHDGRR